MIYPADTIDDDERQLARRTGYAAAKAAAAAARLIERHTGLAAHKNDPALFGPDKFWDPATHGRDPDLGYLPATIVSPSRDRGVHGDYVILDAGSSGSSNSGAALVQHELQPGQSPSIHPDMFYVSLAAADPEAVAAAALESCSSNLGYVERGAIVTAVNDTCLAGVAFKPAMRLIKSAVRAATPEHPVSLQLAPGPQFAPGNADLLPPGDERNLQATWREVLQFGNYVPPVPMAGRAAGVSVPSGDLISPAEADGTTAQHVATVLSNRAKLHQAQGSIDLLARHAPEFHPQGAAALASADRLRSSAAQYDPNGSAPFTMEQHVSQGATGAEWEALEPDAAHRTTPGLPEPLLLSASPCGAPLQRGPHVSIEIFARDLLSSAIAAAKIGEDSTSSTTARARGGKGHTSNQDLADFASAVTGTEPELANVGAASEAQVSAGRALQQHAIPLVYMYGSRPTLAQQQSVPIGQVSRHDVSVAHRAFVPIPPQGSIIDRWFTLTPPKGTLETDPADYVDTSTVVDDGAAANAARAGAGMAGYIAPRVRLQMRWVPLYANKAACNSLSASVDIKGVQVSIIDHKPREMLMLSLSGVRATVNSAHTGDMRVNMRLGNFQLDNQLPGSEHRIIVGRVDPPRDLVAAANTAPDRMSRSAVRAVALRDPALLDSAMLGEKGLEGAAAALVGGNDYDEGSARVADAHTDDPLLGVQLHLKSHPKVTYVQYLAVRLVRLGIEIDDQLLGAVLEFVSHLRFGPDSSAGARHETSRRLQLAWSEAQVQRRDAEMADGIAARGANALVDRDTRQPGLEGTPISGGEAPPPPRLQEAAGAVMGRSSGNVAQSAAANGADASFVHPDVDSKRMSGQKDTSVVEDRASEQVVGAGRQVPRSRRSMSLQDPPRSSSRHALQRGTSGALTTTAGPGGAAAGGVIFEENEDGRRNTWSHSDEVQLGSRHSRNWSRRLQAAAAHAGLSSLAVQRVTSVRVELLQDPRMGSLVPPDAVRAGFSNNSKLYIRNLMLHPIMMELTLTLGDDVDFLNKVIPDIPIFGFLKNIILGLGTLILNVDHAPIEVGSLHAPHVFEDSAMLTERITNFYISNIVRSFYKVVGSVSFLGNPVGLVQNIGSDVVSVLYEPAQGILQGEDAGSSAVSLGRGAVTLVANTTVGVFDSSGKIIQSFARALRSVDPNSTGAATRAATAAGFGRGPSNLGIGLLESGRSVVWGMWKGVSGVVVAPYTGAVEDGGIGFLKGLGAGVVGLFLKPAAGALDGMLLLLKSTSSTISSGSALLTGLQQTLLRVRQRIPRGLGGGAGAGGRALLTSYSRREAEGEARLHHLQSHGKADGESYRFHAPVFDLTLFDEAVPGEHESAYSRLNAKWEAQEAGVGDTKKVKNTPGSERGAAAGDMNDGGDGDGDGDTQAARNAGLDTTVDSASDEGGYSPRSDSRALLDSDQGLASDVFRRGFVVSPAFGGLRFPIRKQGEPSADTAGGAAAGDEAAPSQTVDIMVGPASPSVADGGTEQLVRHRGELLLTSGHLTSVEELLSAEERHTGAMQSRADASNKQGDEMHANMHAAMAPYVLLITDKRVRVLHTATNKVHWSCPLFEETGQKATKLQDINVISPSNHTANFVAMEDPGHSSRRGGPQRQPQVAGQLDKHVLSVSVDKSRRGWALLMGNVQRAAIAFKALSDALDNTPDRISLRKLEMVAYRMTKKKGGTNEGLPSMMSRSKLLLQRRLLTFRRRTLLLHIDSVLVHSWAPGIVESSTYYNNLSHLRDLLLVHGAPLSGMVRSGVQRGAPGDQQLSSIYAAGNSVQGGVSAYRIRVQHVPISVQDNSKPEDKARMSSRLGARPPQEHQNPDVASPEPTAVAPCYTVYRTYEQWARLFAFVPRSWHLPPSATRGAAPHTSFVLPYLPVPQPAFGASKLQPSDYGTDGMLNTLQRALAQLVHACQREAILQAHCHPTALPRPDWLLLRKELERFLGVV